ncbi:MAG TPA: amidohydrolase family protein [Dehalococcoidia bacterium]|jgi:imidazolonepropionase-like amidohydrolase|nr:amidohydrolase family protein [Dehalococcoidia bacterium]
MQVPSQVFKLIKAGRLIDGMGGPPIQDGAVLVQGDKIIAAGPVGEVVAPEGATVDTYDYPGKTVMPGMIDCHTHHNGFGDGRPGEDVAALPDEVITLQAARNARDSLFSGVTSIRDNGAKNMTMFRLREAVNLGIIQAPRMVLCGRPIAIVGGHMGYFGSEVTGPVEATAAVRQLIKEGADYIKISATGGSTRTSFPLLPAFTLDELKAMTGEAHKFGKLTATHCASTQGTIDSLDAGVDMIIHCVFKDADGKANFREDVAERIGAQGAYVNPTVHTARATLWSLQRRKEAQGLSAQEQARLDESLWELEVRWTHLARLIEMGLKIITGSDSSWSSYKLGNTVYETECLVQAGMSPMKGIVSVTSDAAKSLGIDSVTGSLEPGKEADVIIVDGNPAEDINALWNIAEVFLGGQKVDRGPESVLAGVRQHPPVSRPESSIEIALEARH